MGLWGIGEGLWGIMGRWDVIMGDRDGITGHPNGIMGDYSVLQWDYGVARWDYRDYTLLMAFNRDYMGLQASQMGLYPQSSHYNCPTTTHRG